MNRSSRTHGGDILYLVWGHIRTLLGRAQRDCNPRLNFLLCHADHSDLKRNRQLTAQTANPLEKQKGQPLRLAQLRKSQTRDLSYYAIRLLRKP